MADDPAAKRLHPALTAVLLTVVVLVLSAFPWRSTRTRRP
nr:hypothetical protein GCM10025732_52270 [Glycomyces mayteni]